MQGDRTAAPAATAGDCATTPYRRSTRSPDAAATSRADYVRSSDRSGSPLAHGTNYGRPLAPRWESRSPRFRQGATTGPDDGHPERRSSPDHQPDAATSTAPRPSI